MSSDSPACRTNDVLHVRFELCKHRRMSQATSGIVPEWDMLDRLAKALRVGHKSGAQLARELGVHRNTINNYLNGRTRPDRRTLIAWAMSTGVPLEWLESGVVPGPPEEGGPGQGWAPWGSNPQPTDCGYSQLNAVA